MRLKALHTWFLNELRPFYEAHEASVITGMLFENILQADKSQIIKEPGREVDQSHIENLQQALEQLKTHMPVQYVTGTAWFHKLEFQVTPDVLIPRPETEELVQEAVSFIQKGNNLQVLDIGSGSGCIPITIKNKIPGVVVTGIDISSAALSVAKKNAITHDTAITWLQLDFLDEAKWADLFVYDVIISNPPYIPENEKEKLDKNVTAFEPGQALFVPDNEPLVFYKKIAEFGKLHLAEGGKIFMETHEDYAREVAAHFTQEGYEALVIKDFYEKERMVIATRCP